MEKSQETKERWRPLEEFEKYEISTLGKVRNKKTKKVLGRDVDYIGRYRVKLVPNNGGNPTTRYIHNLQKGIARFVRHKNGNVKDNRIENLIYKPRQGEGVTREKTGKFTVRIQFIGVYGPLYFGTYNVESSAKRVAICVLQKMNTKCTLRELLEWSNKQKFSRKNFDLSKFDEADLNIISAF